MLSYGRLVFLREDQGIRSNSDEGKNIGKREHGERKKKKKSVFIN